MFCAQWTYNWLWLCFLMKGIFCAWRISVRESIDGLVPTGQDVQVEAPQGDFAMWSVDSDSCEFANKDERITTLKCNYPGAFVIKPKTSDSGRTVIFIRSPFCYHWHTADSDSVEVWSDEKQEAFLNDTADEEYMFFKVWINKNVDLPPEYHDKPSATSQQITHRFYALGVTPIPHVKSPIQRKFHVEPLLLGYNTEKAYWEFAANVEKIRQHVHYEISGSSVSLGNCFIRTTSAYVTRQTVFEIEGSDRITFTGEIAASGDNSILLLIQDPCAANVVLYLQGADLLLTQNGFLTWQPLIAYNVDGIGVKGNQVKSAAIIQSHIMLYTTSKQLLLINKASSGLSELSLEKSGGNDVLGFTVKDWCESDFLTDYPTMIWWTKDTIYISSDGLRTVAMKSFVELNHLTWSEMLIQSIVLDPLFDVCGLVIRGIDGGNAKTAVVLWDFKADTLDTIMEITSTETFVLKFFRDARISCIAYSPNGEVYIYQYKRSTERLPISQSSIKQVDITFSWQVLVLANNVVVLSAVTRDAPVELHQSLSNTDFFLWVDKFTGITYLVVRKESNPNELIRHTFPVETEVKSVGFPNNFCPYKDLEVSHYNDVLFLDVNESVTLWASLLAYNEPQKVDLQVFQTLNPYLNVTAQTFMNSEGFFLFQNVSLHLKLNDIDFSTYYEVKRNGSEGMLGFQIAPSVSGLACPSKPKMAAYVKIGCPPDRQLRLIRRDPQAECPEFQNFTYTVPKSRVDQRYVKFSQIPQTDGDLTVKYDYEAWGCPEVVKNQVAYQPRLAIYDDNTFVRELSEDFFVYEIFFMKGIDYAISMSKAKCNRQAQEFTEFLTDDVTDPTNAWGPRNYVNCFTEDENNKSKKWRRMAYKILGKSTSNHLALPRDYDGIFVLTAKVLGQNASYCKLSTTFAVKVYGRIPDANVFILSLAFVSFVLLVLVILVASYFNLQQRLYVKGEQFNFEDEDDDSDN